ncbi:PREDICTED: A disintegrin and metalloproteinase with thrombospondin motifs 5-like [Priapulus caudatus]|uniref:A disintegrin and metalloproteinase with thrombospondin motifs 5-like n=1 Tax=Priapulus caudatus TaxID=37621 RepID=A0ABM1EA91_PRICU|nr:PREDICTED: A disintegrin and metalloproteinase with thrombospondin motifs 5-like [Priapulus caudatus]
MDRIIRLLCYVTCLITFVGKIACVGPPSRLASATLRAVGANISDDVLRDIDLNVTVVYPAVAVNLTVDDAAELATEEPTVEVAVFYDAALKRKLVEERGLSEAELYDYILTLMHAAHFAFQQEALSPHNMRIRTVYVAALPQEVLDSQVKEVSASIYLAEFRKIQDQYKTDQQGNQLPHWDYAILLTGIDLWLVIGNKTSYEVQGLTTIGNMCHSRLSTAIVEGRDLRSALNVAHEIGHSLGMFHDGTGRNTCNRFLYIMSQFSGFGKTTWSPCSIKVMANKLGTYSCLNERAWNTVLTNRFGNQRLPGQVFDADQQCAIAMGNGYRRSHGGDLSGLVLVACATNSAA